MGRRTKESKESLQCLLLDCIEAGAWYWFRAEGIDENLTSALNRMKYRKITDRLKSLNIPLPTPEEMYVYATDKWPTHKLHPGPV